MRELSADVVVVGGSLGGVAAALAACRRGRRVVLSESTDWLGGQLTSQAVPPDEHPWIEEFGCTDSYRALREGIREHYRRWYPLRARARSWRELNPGAGRVSGLCHEPRAALAVIEAMLGPHRAAGWLTVLLQHRPVAAEVDGDRVTAVHVEGPGGERTVLGAPYFLDATDGGDLLPLAGAEHVTGAEAQGAFDEPHAPSAAQPANMQACTVCFAVSHHAAEDHTIDRPARYDDWRAHRPATWPGPQLSFTAPDPRTLEPVERWLAPNPDDDPLGFDAHGGDDHGDRELWVFRRILARRLYEDQAMDSDITLVNWPMNDYWLGPVVDSDEASAARHLASARELSLSLLYWLQTEAPTSSSGVGYPGLRIRPDVTGTSDGLAKAPYIRESRRIRAVTTVSENDVALDVVGRRGATTYDDSVGVGSYRIDLHPSTGGDGYLDIASAPFEIPLGALLPVRLRNLLPACKNAGTTHISNGCFRLHPVEWNVGEVAGALASYCCEHGVDPHRVHGDPRSREEFLRVLDGVGVQRHWPRRP